MSENRIPLAHLRKELPVQSKLLLITSDLILALLLTLGIAGMTFALLGIDFNLGLTLTTICFTFAGISLFSLLRWRYRLMILGTPLVLLILIRPSMASIALFLSTWINRFAAVLEGDYYRYLFSNMPNGAYQLMRNDTLPILSVVIVVLLAFCAYLLTCRFHLPTVSLIIVSALVLACSYFDRAYGAPWAAAALLAIVPLYFLSASRKLDIKPRQFVRQYLRTSIAGILSATLLLGPAWILASRITPMDIYSRSAQGIIDDISTMLPDRLRGQRSFDPFSLNRSGFYPLETRLGGSVQLSTAPVMRIQGEASGLLKGQTSVTYTGNSWERPGNEDTWRYGARLFTTEADRVFTHDLSLLDEIGLGDLSLQRSSYNIDIRQSGLTVLFTNGLATDMQFDADSQMLAFFNDDAVLYTQYPLNVGQGYSMDTVSIPFEPLLAQMNALFEADPVGTTERYGPDSSGRFEAPTNGDFSAYLQLPRTVEYRPGGSVYLVAMGVAKGYLETFDPPETLPQDPLSQLNRLLKFFQSMTYSLTVPDVPVGVDFVDHVIDTQIGYCVYYATAMTVMARIIGLPARYVEGYGIPAGTAAQIRAGGLVITGEQAHAWTEVYIDGLGWIALDPTPGGVAGQDLEPDVTGTPLTPSPEPGITTEPSSNFPGITTQPSGAVNTDDPLSRANFYWPVLVIVAVLLLILLPLAASGWLRQGIQMLLINHTSVALRWIAKGRRVKVDQAAKLSRDTDNGRSTDDNGKRKPRYVWRFNEPERVRHLYLIYWTAIRRELHRAARARDLALRRARWKERRRIRKFGPNYKVPEHDFYETKAQSAYTPSAFVRYLNEEASRRQAIEESKQKAEIDRLKAQQKTPSVNVHLEGQQGFIQSWFDPAVVGTWRQELELAIDDLPLLRDPQTDIGDEKTLAERLRTAEQLAERAAFAGPDYRMSAGDIRRISHVLKQLRYIRRHWPLPDIQ